jgi:deoxycytidylate deaminase
MLACSVQTNVVRLAKNLIEVCEGQNWKHYTFLLRRNAVMSIGWNRPFKTHPLAARFGYKFNSIHSELNAITKYDGRITDLSRFTLVNVRLDKAGDVRMSRPCETCQLMLAAFGVSEVWYTTNDGGFAQL